MRRCIANGMRIAGEGPGPPSDLEGAARRIGRCAIGSAGVAPWRRSAVDPHPLVVGARPAMGAVSGYRKHADLRRRRGSNSVASSPLAPRTRPIASCRVSAPLRLHAKRPFHGGIVIGVLKVM
jgi:hypothetical protein